MYLEELQEGGVDPGENGAPSTAPAWLDMDKFNRGRAFFKDNLFSCIMAMMMSLIVGLSVNNLLDPLVFTGQSNEPRKSLRRYVTTLMHLLKWHYGDVWNSPDGSAHKSIMNVRKIHERLAKDMTDNANSGKARIKSKDIEDGSKVTKNVFVSQYDMSIVQSGFIGMITMYPEAFGVEKNLSKLDDYIYFWKGIGYLLGISDKNNICNDGYTKAYTVCKEIENDLVLPALRNPPRDFSQMMNAFIDGISLITRIRFITFEVILLLTLEYSGVNIHQRKLGYDDYIRFYFLKCLFSFVRYCGPFRRLMNRSIEKAFSCDKMN